MEKTHAVYSTKTKIVRLIIWLFLAFVAVITIFPVCYVIFGSFKDNKELLVGGSSILPQKWVFDNYVQTGKFCNLYNEQCVLKFSCYAYFVNQCQHGRIRICKKEF